MASAPVCTSYATGVPAAGTCLPSRDAAKRFVMRADFHNSNSWLHACRVWQNADGVSLTVRSQQRVTVDCQQATINYALVHEGLELLEGATLTLRNCWIEDFRPEGSRRQGAQLLADCTLVPPAAVCEVNAAAGQCMLLCLPIPTMRASLQHALCVCSQLHQLHVDDEL